MVFTWRRDIDTKLTTLVFCVCFYLVTASDSLADDRSVRSHADTNERQELETRSYQVADLVRSRFLTSRASSLQESIRLDGNDWIIRASIVADKADFEPLIDLIKNQVAAETWDSVDGVGQIDVDEDSVALEIRHELNVHGAIERVLDALRRVEDWRIELNGSVVVLADEDYEGMQDLSNAVETQRLLADRERRLLERKAMLGNGAAVSLPLVSICNSGALEINIGSLQMRQIDPITINAVMYPGGESAGIILNGNGESGGGRLMILGSSESVALDITNWLSEDMDGEHAILFLQSTIVHLGHDRK